MIPNKIPKKLSSKLRQENHNKELRKSPQRRTGKAPHNLEEPRRTIYTYHEGSYKVLLTQNQHLAPSTQQAEQSWVNTRAESEVCQSIFLKLTKDEK
jgi:hypothetical protein